MNHWSQKSMVNAYQMGYLDKLLEIYPIRTNPKRSIPNSLWKKIQEAYDNHNSKKLIRLFNIGVKNYDLKFPVESYYNSSLRNEEGWIDLNPETVKKLGKLILDIDIDALYDRCAMPKKVSRQVGPMFDNWFINKFKNDREITLLGTSDNERKQNAKNLINYHSNKGLDVFIKINDIYLLGEAKFITDSGGTQANQFKSALNIVNTFNKKNNVVPLSILDGHCWRKANDQFYNTIKNSKDNHIIISALLLDELFDIVKKVNLPPEGLLNHEIIEMI